MRNYGGGEVKVLQLVGRCFHQRIIHLNVKLVGKYGQQILAFFYETERFNFFKLKTGSFRLNSTICKFFGWIKFLRIKSPIYVMLGFLLCLYHPRSKSELCWK